MARKLSRSRPEVATMVSARAMACVGGGGLGEFKNLTLIGKGSFGRVYRGVRICDNVE